MEDKTRREGEGREERGPREDVHIAERKGGRDGRAEFGFRFGLARRWTLAAIGCE